MQALSAMGDVPNRALALPCGTQLALSSGTAPGEKKAMLRITRMVGDGSIEILKLEGTLHGPWVDETLDAHNLSAVATSRICLDLSGLTFADEAGAALLRDLIRSGASVVGCSSYIAELLQLSPRSS
jgi:ABC-type transporter Mla MlaB component